MLLASAVSPARAADDASLAAPVTVIVTRARVSCFTTNIRATGYLTPRARAVVMFNAPGFRLANILGKEGETVAAGDVLASLKRLETRPPPGGAPPPDAPQQQAADPMPPPPDAVRATAAGLIVKSDAVDGQLTSPTAGPLFTIAVNGEIELQADVSSIDALELAAGQTARLTLEDGREFSGRVRLVPAEIDRTSQTGAARIAIDGAQGLVVGTFVKVVIDANRACNVIAVPRAALIQTAAGTKVQVVANGVIATRLVHTGALSSTEAALADGVAAGDLVVASAGTSLRDGDKVRPIFAEGEEDR